MADHSQIHRARNLAAEIAEQNDKIRQITAEAAEALKLPQPDTFLGRKTQEPFRDEDPLKRVDIHNLIHSELQPPKQ
ncbi:hypothetical protein QA649_17975 [Bradyrhizobium sp. CB1717]|uniref:hypothetical protein n=1 Tax=Bradyrhizobium sp. CB1717 TaxID=3039154 RepID=UPI0024B0F4B4|nr:hypothetical protein [Bradyrhizobium sp. CB1717]WFU28035.1 hypothetical protein QA649_17975 [Bradyrhizobium sp. CB1717]